MQFYRRNYIEGLFLSSGIIKNPSYTMELLYQTLFLLRNKYRFMGYIHVKGIPGADPLIIEKTGYLADRMSINLELPTREGLEKLAPNKPRSNILKNMRQIQNGIENNRNDIVLYRNAPKFVSGGQSTQMIIGATPENDYTPSRPFTLTVEAGPYADANPGYKKLHIRSGGADNPREIILRQKGDGTWLLWDQFLLVSIRQPKSADPWA